MQYRRKTVITTRNFPLYGLNEIRYDKAGKTISILCNDNKYQLFEFICLFIHFGILPLVRHILSIKA